VHAPASAERCEQSSTGARMPAEVFKHRRDHRLESLWGRIGCVHRRPDRLGSVPGVRGQHEGEQIVPAGEVVAQRRA
jgi:hypothetical protein